MLEAYKLVGSKACNIEWLKEVSWELLIQNLDLRKNMSKLQSYLQSDADQV